MSFWPEIFEIEKEREIERQRERDTERKRERESGLSRTFIQCVKIYAHNLNSGTYKVYLSTPLQQSV